MSDPINHPAHYNVGKIEVDDAIADWKLGFRLGNVIKYVARSDHKGAPLEDLKKAQWYLEREIKAREGISDPSAFQVWKCPVCYGEGKHKLECPILVKSNCPYCGSSEGHFDYCSRG